jgi:hypothetical protein
MKSVDDFIEFLKHNFSSSILSIEDFKHDLRFIEIDCLNDKRKKIVMYVSADFVKISEVDKDMTLDFPPLLVFSPTAIYYQL